MKKRLMALICATLLVGSMSMTAFATNPSVTAGVVTGIDKVVDKNNAVVDGDDVKVIVEAIADNSEYADERDYIQVESNMKKELEKLNAYKSGMKVIDVKNVKAVGNEASIQWPVAITFNVTGIKAGDEVVLLQYTGNAWKKINATTGNGTVTATFDSLSPVAFIKVADAATTSPTTGEPVSLMLAGAVVALGTVGTVISKKRK